MKHLVGRRSLCECFAVLAIGLLAGGCDWTQFGFNSSHTGDNVFDTTITPANVSNLTSQFVASDGTSTYITPKALVNGILYATAGSGIEAYSANGTTGCSGSPTTCAPMWSYSTNVNENGVLAGSIDVVSGVVYVYTTSNQIEAFNASGQTDCSGSPKVCQPLWSAAGPFSTPPTISGGTMFAQASGGPLEAFDASGQIDCSGSPRVCQPQWSSSFTATGNEVTVSGGNVYVGNASGGAGNVVAALDATGTRNCGGSPKVCSPRWDYHTNYTSDGFPVVSGSTLYIDTLQRVSLQFSADLEAFDANGANGCSGTPSICSPLWTGSAFSLLPFLVGDNGVFVEDSGQNGFVVSSANGSVSPEWSSSVGDTPLAIGGSVVYSTDNTNVYAFDAGGNSGCSGSPLICTPLWSARGTSAIVANGMVYIGTQNTSGEGEVVVYGLPGS
jgi:hypothetical protein